MTQSCRDNRNPLHTLVDEIGQCRICADHFPHEPRPIVQLSTKAKVLIAGQAPGSKVQQTGVPFDDPSGDRLRDWMGVSRSDFYDADKIAILPMGFCYPGSGKSGDLPPRRECAATWRRRVLDLLPNIELTLLLGQHAMAWHLGDAVQRNLTETVEAWNNYTPACFPLPHPSPRNNIWMKKNPWFEQETLPAMRARVASLLG